MSQQPPDDAAASPPLEGQPGAARAKTRPLGLLLLVLGVLNLIGGGWMILRGIEDRDKTGQEFVQQLRRGANRELLGRDVDPEDVKLLFLRLAFIGGPLALIVSVLTITAGVCVRSLKHHRLAMLGAALATIPGLTPLACCGVGQLIGIWTVLVLRQPEVKSAFSGH